MNSFTSFSRRLTRRIVFSLILALVVLFACVFYLTATTTKELNEFSFNSIMDVQSEIVEKMLYGVELSVNCSVGDVEDSLANPHALYNGLKEELEVHPHIMGFFAAFEPYYFPEQGRWFEPYAVRRGDSIVTKQVGSPSHDYQKREWYRKALQNGSGCWSEPYWDHGGSDSLLCTFAIPLRDAKGRKVGVFGADVSLDWLYRQLQETDLKANIKRIGLAEESEYIAYTFIIDNDGTYIVHPDQSRVLKDKFTAFDFTNEKTGYREIELDGEKVYVFFEDLHNTRWTLGFVVKRSEVWEPVMTCAIVMLLAMALGLLAVYLFSRVTIRRATKPLHELALSADEVARGNFSAPLPTVEYHDEIYQLRRSFANMQQSLTGYIEELKETTSEKAALENELSISRGIQMAMLPKTYPAFPGRNDIDVYGMMMPAKEVGGDLFDFLIRGDRFYFCIGDVSGKGIPAALLMTVTRSLFRTLANEEQNPERIMTRINTSLCYGNEGGWFVTMFIGVLDLKNGRLTYCNAGHVPPLLLGSEVSLLPIEHVLAVGSMELTTYTAMETTLKPHTALFLYTDGLTEAMNSSNHMFGDERMMKVAEQKLQEHQLQPKQIIEAMEDGVKSYVGGAEQSDDLTMLAILYSGENVEESGERKEEKDKREVYATLNLCVSIDEVPRISDFVISRATQAGMSRERGSELRLIVEEAVANVVNYSGATGMMLDVAEQDGALCVMLTDDGIAFDPTTMPPPDLTVPGEQRQIGGLGIHFMRKMSDRLSYRREDDKNILTIIKNIK